MLITALKAQAKDPGRISVFIDDIFSFSLTQDQIIEHKVRTGQKIDADRLRILKKASDFGKAYGHVLRFIAVRPRSIKEVANYCRRKNIDPEDCHVISRRLQDKGYVNDTTFAKSWAESRRLHSKPISAQKLRFELAQKGISEADVNNAIALSGYDESKALRSLIAKMRRQARYQDNEKLTRYLLRQGFGYQDIRQAVAELG